MCRMLKKAQWAGEIVFGGRWYFMANTPPEEYTRGFLPRTYMVGDEIRISITLRHQPRFDDVEIIFVNQQQRGSEITLRLDMADYSQEGHGRMADGFLSTSFELSCVIPLGTPPGVYNPTIVRCRTVGGKRAWLVHDHKLGSLKSADIEILDESLDGTEVTAYNFIEPDDEDY